MHIRSVKTFWKAALMVMSMVMLSPIAAAADTPQNFQVVDGVAIYLGVMPAQLVQGHTAMHGGVSAARYRDHLVVALFDNATGRRIEDAQATAAAMAPGLSSQWKALESMRVAEAVTYGNYFDMPREGAYHIQLRIRRPGQPQLIKATFTHRHFER